MTKAIDGYVDDRMWARLEMEFDDVKFWNLQSERRASGPNWTRIYLDACKDGKYHAEEREPNNLELASIVRIFTLVGKIEWLEEG